MSELTGEGIKKRIENSNRLRDQLERDNGVLDMGAVYEGVQREEEERAEQQRKIREKKEAQRLAEQKEWDDLMVKTGETLDKESKERAAQELKKETEQVQRELQEKINKANNLKSESQLERDAAYRSMLSKFKD